MGMKSNIWMNIGKVKDARANFSPLMFRSITLLPCSTIIQRAYRGRNKAFKHAEINRY